MEAKQQIIKQVEYYLGDSNLKNDRFFFDQLKQNEDRMLPLELILNCTKIKKLNVTKQEVINALKDSLFLQIDEEKERVGRKDRSLPKFKYQRFIILEKDDYVKTQEELQQGDDLILFYPEVFNYTQEGFIKSNINNIFKKIEKAIGADVVFYKMSKKGGVIVVNKMSCDFNDLVQRVHSQKLNIIGHNFTFSLMEKDRRDSFIERNNSSIMIALKRKYNATLDRRDKAVSNVKDYDEMFGPVVIAGKSFPDIRSLKNKIKLVIFQTQNGQSVDQKFKDVVVDLLKQHDCKEKVDDIMDVVVDVNPDHPETRCFFIVDSKGNKSDISFHKCLYNIQRNNQPVQEEKDQQKFIKFNFIYSYKQFIRNL